LREKVEYRAKSFIRSINAQDGKTFSDGSMKVDELLNSCWAQKSESGGSVSNSLFMVTRSLTNGGRKNSRQSSR
jgi:hypothetical protein